MPGNIGFIKKSVSKDAGRIFEGYLLPDPFLIRPFRQEAPIVPDVVDVQLFADDLFSHFTAEVIVQQAIFVR